MFLHVHGISVPPFLPPPHTWNQCLPLCMESMPLPLKCMKSVFPQSSICHVHGINAPSPQVHTISVPPVFHMPCTWNQCPFPPSAYNQCSPSLPYAMYMESMPLPPKCIQSVFPQSSICHVHGINAPSPQVHKISVPPVFHMPCTWNQCLICNVKSYLLLY